MFTTHTIVVLIIEKIKMLNYSFKDPSPPADVSFGMTLTACQLRAAALLLTLHSELHQ